MPLTQDQIEGLLKGELARLATPPKGRGAARQPDARKLPRPQQLGPLILTEKSSRCVSRNCGSSTNLKVKGYGYLCMTHTLYALNNIVLQLEGNVNLEDCTCKSGQFTKGHTHTVDCPLYNLIGEDDDSD